VATVALANNDPRYREASLSLWENMVGRRMHVTGGCGSFRYEEMFGPDYVLPNDGYLETCAAVGAAFFSGRMAEIHGDGKYFDAFERSLYNNVLSGISLSGDLYSYENPLIGEGVTRWSWHSCPCCPPMFLKIAGELPGYIYSKKNSAVYVNLFIGSEAKIQLDDDHVVTVKQSTKYPWDGHVAINIQPETRKEFSVRIRIPGWAQSVENPFDLYRSEVKSKVTIKVNGRQSALKITRGYAEITRKWAKGDVVELELPMEPRFVYAHENVKNLNGMVVVSSGPVVYGLEELDNPGLISYLADTDSPVTKSFKHDVLNGVNIIKGRAFDQNEVVVDFTAVPFFAINNRLPGNPFKVWIPVKE